MVTEDRLYTPREVAKELSLTPRTVTDYCREGRIPSVLFGTPQRKYYRITAATLHNLKNFGLPTVTDDSWVWETE